MGDRANILVKSGDEQICLYTHWGGRELPQTLKVALEKRARWDDFQYLNRIIFCEMMHEKDGDAGYGITNKVHDDSYGPITVNVDKNTVCFDGCDPVSFEEYISSNPESPKYQDDKDD